MESSTPRGGPFKGSAEVYAWIEGFINLERDINARSMKLENMRTMSRLAGNPEQCAQAIHAAGSKGKGSVTGMCAAILKAAGYKCARYASPHVRDFRERITLGGAFFEESVYAEAGNELRRAAELYREGGKEPSFFELFTLWFFLCSRISACAVMSVETGLGGRLDATNIIDPLVSVITIIEKEHTAILGDTIEKIAGEKAGIVKHGKPLVLAEQESEALDVFRKKAAEQESPLFYFPEIARISGLKINREGSSFDLDIACPAFSMEMKNISILIPGEIQAGNAALAVLAVKTAFPRIDESAVRKGLASFSLPARFEKIGSCPPVIIDGAHTAVSFAECVKNFADLYGERGLLIFGCAADKDARSMARAAVSRFSKIAITAPGSFKKSVPEELYAVFSETASERRTGTEILFIPETKEAVKRVLGMAKERNLPVLGAGSFYLAAEIAESA